MKKQAIGFIGAGNLAMPIINNLIESGYDLYCYNRTREKLQSVEGKVTIGNNIREVCDHTTIIFSLIADDPGLRKICLSEGGLTSCMKPGTIHVSMSTVSPAIAAELEATHQQKGFTYIASPIMGRPEAAAAKKLGICIAGETIAKESVKEILPEMGAAAVYDFGEKAASANVAKLGINFMIAAAMETISEVFDMVNANGVKPEEFYAMAAQNLFNCPIYKNYGEIILAKKFDTPQFYARLGLKDMILVNEAAEIKEINMPLGKVLKTNYQKVVDMGLGEKDWAVLAVAANGE
jgi:3-hydroxyisobutyrate dehydrogenase-like beta-hydroxyacid dehydrogenase